MSLRINGIWLILTCVLYGTLRFLELFSCCLLFGRTCSMSIQRTEVMRNFYSLLFPPLKGGFSSFAYMSGFQVSLCKSRIAATI